MNTFFLEKRKEKCMTLEGVAKRAGLDHSQISRLENGSSAMGVFAAVRLSFALGISREEILSEQALGVNPFWGGKPPRPEFPAAVITERDIVALDALGWLTGDHSRDLVLRLLEYYVARFPEISESDRPALVESIFTLMASGERSDAVTRKWFHNRSFNYPFGMDAQLLMGVHAMGGALVLQDLGALIYGVREARGHSLRTLASQLNDQHEQVKGKTHMGVWNLEHNPNQRMRVKDVLEVDMALGLNGALLTMAWDAASFYLGLSRQAAKEQKIVLPWTPAELQRLEKLIIASRFLQKADPQDRYWYDTLVPPALRQTT